MVGGSESGKCETLQDGETSVFLCETKTFPVVLISRPRFRPLSEFAKNLRLQDVRNRSKNETARLVKFHLSLILRPFFRNLI